MRYSSHNYESVQNRFSYSARHLLHNEKQNCNASLTSSVTSGMTEETKSGEDFSFLVPVFNYFYYLLIVPFKVVLDTESNQYRIQTHILHKIVCPFVHAVVVFSIVFLWLLSFFQFEKNSDPTVVGMFNFGDYLANAFLTTFTIFILWQRRDKILEVIECTRVPLERGKVVKLLIYVSIGISSTALCVINWFFLRDEKHHGSLHHLLEKYIPGRNHSSDGDLLQTVLNVLFAYASLFNIAALGPIFLLIFALGQLGKQFGAELETAIDVQKGTQLYRRLKRKTNCITKLYGKIILSHYITCICYYAEAPHVLLGKRGDAEKAFMVYYGFTGVLWILAAEFHKNIQETVLNWIAFHSGKPDLSIEDRLKLVAISNEMAADPVALSSRYFYVTYQQFSSMLGLVVTYGIIVFQLHNGPNRTETS